MWPSRRELSDITKDLAAVETRLRLVEEEAKTTKAIRAARAERRDWYVSKLIPAVSGLIVALLAVQTIFHVL